MNQNQNDYNARISHMNRNISLVNSVNSHKEKKQSSSEKKKFEVSDSNINNNKMSKMIKCYTVRKEDHPLFDSNKHSYVGTNINNDSNSCNNEQFDELNDEKRRMFEETAFNNLIPKLFEKKHQKDFNDHKEEEEASKILNLFFANKYCN